MQSKITNFHKVQAEIIKTLSHPVRIFIVTALAKEDICVCDLTQKIGYSMSTVSKHLNVLKTAGIVETKKLKNNVYYHLKCKCVLNFLDCAGKVLNSCIKQKVKLAKTRREK